MPVQEEPSINLEGIYKLIGERKFLLKSLVEYIKAGWSVKEEFVYSKKTGWSVYYRKGSKSLAVVNVRKGGFSVVVVIGPSLEGDMKKAKLGKKVMKMFTDAYPYHDGRWLNFDVKTKEDIEDIKKLLFVKFPKKLVVRN